MDVLQTHTHTPETIRETGIFKNTQRRTMTSNSLFLGGAGENSYTQDYRCSKSNIPPILLTPSLVDRHFWLDFFHNYFIFLVIGQIVNRDLIFMTRQFPL